MATTSAGDSQSQLETNSRGIPHAPFISNVQEHLGGPDEPVEPTLNKFQETMSKYKFMELNTAQRRSGLEDKIPDIRKTLQMVQFLSEKKEDPESIETTFELNDTLYAKAHLDPVNTVHLWLGANVMLEYPLDEAKSLLTGKLSGAEKSLVAAKEDLDFLREQITVMEVNTARVHNWDVKRRRERREQLERDGIDAGKDDVDPKTSIKASSWLSSDREDERSNGASEPKIELPTIEIPPSGLDTSSQTAISQEPIPSKTADSEMEKSVDAERTESVTTAKMFLPDFPEASTTATTAVDTSRTNGNSATDILSSTTIIVPPLNFNMVSKGIYRSGHPNERNFEFLKRLNLKSVMYLANEDYRSNMVDWATSQGINIFHFRLAINKEPMAEMDEQDVSKALQVILQRKNWPILIHCNKGKYRVGCLVGLLRRLQGWSHTSIFEEYSRFAGTKISDLEYIEVFDLSQISLAR